MCGIAGALTFDTVDAEPVARAVDAMTRTIAHRGPDGEGRWHAAHASGCAVALGHRRLAIIDLSAGGAQPMHRHHAVVTYNGEIYNYRELREELQSRGVAFTTGSDTEVLLAAYVQWGASFVERLSGMFAFGLWDADEARLLLARDRFGVKPLYYWQGAGQFAFASEVRAVLASGWTNARLDADSLWHYLGYQTAPTPATLLQGIRMLEPGHVMEVRGDGRVTSRRYWSLLAPGEDAQDGRAGASIAAARGHVRELLHKAVTSHLVSDVPVGVFLSGGIDSGALVSVLGDAGVRASTFTIGLDDDAADESADARTVADAFGADHTEIRLRAADLLEMLPDALAAVDHPSGDGINTFVVSRAVHDHGLKVALSGLGGDEMFGGYASFRRLGRAMPAARQLGRAPIELRQAAARLLRTAGGGRVATNKAAAVIEGTGTLAEMWPITRQLFTEPDRRRLLTTAYAPTGEPVDAYASLLADAYAEAAAMSSVAAGDSGVWARISYAEARGYMHDVLLRDTDQMSMSQGLEVRVPFLDHHLAAYVVSLPDAVKSAGRPKSLLIDALRRPLPAVVANTPKRGFTLPFDAWMRGELRGYCETQLGAEGLDGRGLFKPGAVSQLWSRFLNRAPGVTWSRVWALVALNAWLERQQVSVDS